MRTTNARGEDFLRTPNDLEGPRKRSKGSIKEERNSVMTPTSIEKVLSEQKHFRPQEFTYLRYFCLEVFGGFAVGEASNKELKAVKSIANFVTVPIGKKMMILTF